MLACLVQSAMSLLDLAGVVLLGLVGALAAALIGSQALPASIAERLQSIGYSDMSGEAFLALVSATAAILLLVKSISSSWLLRRTFRFLAGQQAQVSARLTSALLSQPLSFVSRRSSQQTAYTLVQGSSAATLIVLGQGIVFVSELALLVLIGSALLVINPMIALASVIYFVLVAVALQRGLGRWSARSGQGLADVDVASLGLIQEVVDAYREILVGNRRETYVKRLEALRWQAAGIAADLQFIYAFPKYVVEVALVIGSLALAGVLFATQSTTAAVGTLALFLAAATRVMPSLLRMQGALLTLRNAAGMAEQTFALAEDLEDVPAQGTAHVSFGSQESRSLVSPSTFNPTVQARHLTYFYPGSHTPAVQDVSLSIAAGSHVALVGKSGAGKSTLADLILGVIEPTMGAVHVSGCPPQQAAVTWPGAIGYVPQQVALANSTIRSNVALGVPDQDIDDAQVLKVLDSTGLSDLAHSESELLDLMIGERGTRLSGGQRQRLGLARALYSNPGFLVLDEATSALDVETELAIARVVASLGDSVTTLVIAHRLSTVRNADLVIYLDRGSSVAAGTFTEVRQQVPSFDRQAHLLGLR